MKNIFTIKEQCLIFREQVRHLRNLLLKKMKKSGDNELFLDLSRVLFMSRSFADELINLIENLDLQNKKIKLINQSLAIEQLLNTVKNTKKKIKKELSFTSTFSKF